MSVRLKEGMDANIQILSENATYTLEDQALLAEYSAKLYDSGSIMKMRID